MSTTYAEKGFALANLFVGFLVVEFFTVSNALPYRLRACNEFKIIYSEIRSTEISLSMAGKSLFIRFCAGFSCQLLFYSELMAPVGSSTAHFRSTHLVSILKLSFECIASLIAA